ncbi:MAG: ubiquitin-like domain-containing protein [Candidatus Saccharimonadales bacterium]
MQKAKERLKGAYQKGKHRAGRVKRHPAGLPLMLFLALVLVSGVGLYFGLHHHTRQLTVVPNQNYLVIVKADGAQRTIPTDADTVGQLLKRLHVRLAKGDRVEPALDAKIVTDNFRVNVYRAVPVTVLDGVHRTVGSNAAATPRSMIRQAGIELFPEDEVEVRPTENFVTQQALGNRLVIQRATPVSVSFYSAAPTQLRTQSKTVGEFIKSASIKLTKDDTVKPAESTAITPNMHIAVVRNGIQTITVEEDIPAPTETILDTSLSFGSQAVRQEGSAGKQTKTYKVTIEHGDEVSRVLLQTVVTVQPVKRVIAKGNTVNIPADKQAVMAAAGISPNDYGYVDYIFSRESHWNTAAASSNGYYGLGQTNLGKLSAACPNWQSDAVCQTRLFTSYANRYGGWAGSYNFWLSHGWW